MYSMYTDDAYCMLSMYTTQEQMVCQNYLRMAEGLKILLLNVSHSSSLGIPDKELCGFDLELVPCRVATKL